MDVPQPMVVLLLPSLGPLYPTLASPISGLTLIMGDYLLLKH